MGTLNDRILRATEGPTVNDGLRSYYAKTVPNADLLTLPELERAFLLGQMPVADKRSTTFDLWMEYLTGVWGYTGTLNDMLTRYWFAQGGDTTFNPNQLFMDGEPGFWHDYADFSTLFQDAAGTIPVTEVGQPVGRINDKSPNGIVATQSVAGSRPTLGRNPYAGTRNLLTYTEDLSNAAWTKPTAGTGVTAVVTQNYAAAPDGTTTACRVVLNKGAGATSGDYSGIQQTSAVTGAGTGSIWIKTTDGTPKNITLKVASLTTAVAIDGTWTRITVTETNPAYIQLILRGTYGTSDSADILIWHPQLETGSTATDYQKVVTKYDVTEAGQNDCYYLDYDGSGDFLQTAAIDFTVTSQISVFTGIIDGQSNLYANIINLGDALQGSVPGGFWLHRPTVPQLIVTVQGSTMPTSYTGLGEKSTSPLMEADTPYVITAVMDCDGGGYFEAIPVFSRQPDTIIVDATGAASASGTFGNLPAFLGRNFSTTFKGKMYSAIVLGREANEAEIIETEVYVGHKTGITL